MTRSLAIVLRQLYLLRGSPARFISQFTWITVDMILWGFLSRYLNTVASPGFDFIPALLGAVLLWNFFIRVMQGVTMTLFEDVWSRNFLNIFGSPMSIWNYLGGLVLSSILTSTVALVFMFAFASVVFRLPTGTYGMALLPFLLILFVGGITLGIIGSAVVLRYGPAAEWLIWPLPALISPFAGVTYPLSTLPQWMQVVGTAVPPSYVFEALRGHAAPQPLLIGFVLATAYLFLACWVFVRVYKHALRSGLIARYSAESLS